MIFRTLILRDGAGNIVDTIEVDERCGRLTAERMRAVLRRRRDAKNVELVTSKEVQR